MYLLLASELASIDFVTNFTVIDWSIVAVYLAATVVIGVLVNHYISSMDDYVVAGRSLRPYLSVATMVGSELGLITVMYAAQTGFTSGFASFHIGLIAGIVTLVVGLTGFIVVPLRRMAVKTIPEFYARRFTPGVRVYGGLILALAGILNMGLFLKFGAIFVANLTGLHDTVYINIAMTVLLALVLSYTILGGMVSVVITDYLQFIVLSIGLIICCGLAVSTLGWSNIVETSQQVYGDKGFDPTHEDGFGWNYIAWMALLGLVAGAVWQTTVMRACSTVDIKTVKKMYCWSSIGFLIRMMLPQFLGICAMVYLWQDDVGRTVFFTADGQIVSDPEVTATALPIFLSQILPIGLIGIIAAGMLAAFMSTHDSYLLCWAAVLTEDVVGPCVPGKGLSMRARLILARVFIFAIGLFLLVWGLWYPLEQNLWDYMAVSGAIYFIGATVVLATGLYWKRASTVGAYAALTCGGLMIAGLGNVNELIGLDALDKQLAKWDIPLTIDGATIGLTALLIAFVVMILGSLLFPDKHPRDEAAMEQVI
jgi:SSS family solute:Na+ symporter